MQYRALYNHYEYYFPLEEKITPVSSASTATSTPPPEQKSSNTSEVSGGHSVLNLSELYRYLEEKKWEYCVWISKVDRDHNLNPIGRVDPQGVAFDKLEKGLGLKFSNANGWETVIGAKDGLYFSWSINKNGYIRFWINEKLSWELFFQLLQEKLKRCALTNEEFKEIIECLEDEERKKLFYLETANMIGPREVIEREFNKACLIYKKVYFDGLYLPVLVKIDKSKGPHEIEYQGPEGPTRRLQDITSRAVEVVESMGVLDFKLNSELQVSLSNNELLEKHGKKIVEVETGIEQLQQQIVGKDEFKIEATELEGQLLNLFVENDVYQLEQRTHFTNLLKASLKNAKTAQLNAENIIDLIKTLEREFPELKNNIEQIVYDNIEPIVSGQQALVQKIDNLNTSIKKEFDTLKEFVSSEFKETRIQVRNNLYLVLRKMQELPGATVKELTKELNLPKSSV
jgi:hypothetical protein